MNRQRTEREIDVQVTLCEEVEAPINRRFDGQLGELEVFLRDQVSDRAWHTYCELQRIQSKMHAQVVAAAFWCGADWKAACQDYETPLEAGAGRGDAR